MQTRLHSGDARVSNQDWLSMISWLHECFDASEETAEDRIDNACPEEILSAIEHNYVGGVDQFVAEGR